MSKVKELLQKQNEYIAACGGLPMHEADEVYNGMNREIIAAFYEEHETSYIGKINIYDVPREKIKSGEYDVVTEYTGQFVHNFDCSFIIPCRDEELEQLIRDWNCGNNTLRKNTSMANAIITRVLAIGGVGFSWT